MSLFLYSFIFLWWKSVFGSFPALLFQSISAASDGSWPSTPSLSDLECAQAIAPRRIILYLVFGLDCLNSSAIRVHGMDRTGEFFELILTTSQIPIPWHNQQ